MVEDIKNGQLALLEIVKAYYIRPETESMVFDFQYEKRLICQLGKGTVGSEALALLDNAQRNIKTSVNAGLLN